jgi:hypothetical protein
VLGSGRRIRSGRRLPPAPRPRAASASRLGSGASRCRSSPARSCAGAASRRRERACRQRRGCGSRTCGGDRGSAGSRRLRELRVPACLLEGPLILRCAKTARRGRSASAWGCSRRSVSRLESSSGISPSPPSARRPHGSPPSARMRARPRPRRGALLGVGGVTKVCPWCVARPSASTLPRSPQLEGRPHPAFLILSRSIARALSRTASSCETLRRNAPIRSANSTAATSQTTTTTRTIVTAECEPPRPAPVVSGSAADSPRISPLGRRGRSHCVPRST